MVRRFAVAAFVILFGARQVAACSGRNWGENDLVENTPVYSANGRFCVIVRWNEGVADFATERAGKAFGWDKPKPVDDSEQVVVERKTVTAAFYEIKGGTRRLISEIPLDIGSVGDVLVPDSGRYVVAVRAFGYGGCGRYAEERDPLVAVYNAVGTRVGGFTVGDVFNSYDVLQLSSSSGVSFTLRHETEDREVVVLSIAAPHEEGKEQRYVERRVDVVTAALLDEKREIYPAPHVYAEPGIRDRRRDTDYGPSSPGCAVVFGDPQLVRIDPTRLFSQAVRGPMPSFPTIALKARIRGVVWVDVAVSESGDVLCARSRRFPFGLDAVAIKAVRRWKFRPFRIDGHATRVAGEVLVHFKDVDQETWSEVVRRSPPGDDF